MDATLFGDGGLKGASDAAELDVVSSTPEQRPPADIPNDAGVTDVADAGADAAPVSGPAPAGFVQCGAATCDIGSDYCCGERAECLPRDGGFGCSDGFIRCDSTSDCPEGEFCRISGPYKKGYGQKFASYCLQGNVGFPKVYPDFGQFEILACDPDPTPPYQVCTGGAPCIRQSCRGFVFDLCGVIPDGGCDP